MVVVRKRRRQVLWVVRWTCRVVWGVKGRGRERVRGWADGVSSSDGLEWVREDMGGDWERGAAIEGVRRSQLSDHYYSLRSICV